MNNGVKNIFREQEGREKNYSPKCMQLKFIIIIKYMDINYGLNKLKIYNSNYLYLL